MKTKIRAISIIMATVMLFTAIPMDAFARSISSSDSEEGVYIIKELTELRDKFSKTFLKSDGSMVEIVSADQLHYEDAESGTWEEIDNTLKAVEEDGITTYRNSKSPVAVEIPESLAGNDVRVSIGEYSIRIAHIGADESRAFERRSDTKDISEYSEDEKYEMTAKQLVDASAAKAKNGIVFAGAYKDTTVVYDAVPGGIKESVIIEEVPETEPVYEYEITTTGLKAELTKDGKVVFSHDGDTVFEIAHPYMEDTAGETTSEVSVDLTEENGVYKLVYKPDYEWLTDEAREYPVLLDPTVIASGSSEIIDTYTGITYDQPVLIAGYNQYGSTDVYIKITNSVNVPAESIITSAKLYLCPTTGSDTDVSYLYNVVGAWSDNSITSNNAPECEDDIIDYCIHTAPNEEYVNWDITKLVSKGLDELLSGVKIVQAPDNNSGAYLYFRSVNATEKNPYIEIEYQNVGGLAGGVYKSMNIGQAGTAYLNTYTGGLTVVRDEIGVDGNVMPVNIAMVYNSSAAGSNDYGCGYGFKTSYNIKLEYQKYNPEMFILEDWDGSKVYFERDNDVTIDGETDREKIYVDNSGRGYSIYVGPMSSTDYNPVTAVGEGQAFSLVGNTDAIYVTDANGYRNWFDENGRLIKQTINMPNTENVNATSTDLNGGVVNVSYGINSDRIARITDGADRVYDFVYNTSTNLLERIQYKGNGSSVLKQVSYDYTDGLTVTYGLDNAPNNTEAYYTFDSNNRLTSATAYDGYSISFAYTDGKVTGITEKDTAGTVTQIVSVSYGDYVTTFTETGVGSEMIQFDESGNVISVQDANGNAVFASYGAKPSIKAPNKLISVSALQRSSINILSDGNAEAQTTSWVMSNNVSKTTNDAYDGSKSFQMLVAMNPQSCYLTQSVTLKANTYYTFSAYVKTQGVIGTGARLVLAGASTTVKASETITGTKDWCRISTTVLTDSAPTSPVAVAAMYSATGVVYFDCLQVEEGIGAGNYNYISNAGCDSLTNWTASPSSAVSVYTDPNSSYPYEKSIAVAGDPTGDVAVSQTINISGSAGDVYSFGGWAKSAAVPITSDSRKFGIRISFNNTDSTTTEEFCDFSVFPPQWQYMMAQATAEKDYSSITIELVYDYQCNTSYFDKIQLYAVDIYEHIEQEEWDGISGRDTSEVIDEYDRLEETVSSEGVGRKYTYDGFNNVIAERITNGRVSIKSNYTYTTDGNYFVSETDSYGNVQTYDYDTQLGLLESVIGAAGEEVEYTYNDAQQLVQISQAVTGLAGGATEIAVGYAYDNGGRVTQITRGGTDYTIAYNTLGMPVSISVGNLTLVTYGYNSEYELSSITYGTGTFTYTYDNYGNVATVGLSGGKRYIYNYNALGELESVINEDVGRRTEYTTDSTGAAVTTVYKVTVANDVETSTQVHKYFTSETENPKRRVFREVIGSDQYETNLISDGEGRDNGAWWSITSGSVTTDTRNETYYDDLGRVSGGSLYRVERDGNDDLEQQYSVELLNTEIDYYNAPDYTTGERVRRIELYNASGFGKSYSYAYDGSGRITQADDIRYSYDEAGQLVRVDDPDNDTTVYTYDDAGNIVSVKTYDYTTGTLGTVLSTKTYTYDSSWSDKLLTVTGGSHTMTYYSDGTPRRYYDGKMMTWKDGRLCYVLKSPMTVNYAYDEDGLRISKKIRNANTTEFTYINGLLTSQNDGTDSLYFRYTADGAPIAFEYNGDEYYYVRNLQGDITAILDDTGACVVEYSYDAWGKPLSVSGSLAATVGAVNPLRYRGYYYDTETGFYYLQSRYYDPAIGRFISPDSIDYLGANGMPLSYNLYAYCENNSTNMIDNYGFKARDITSTLMNIMRSSAARFAEYIKKQVTSKGLVKGLKDAFDYFIRNARKGGGWDLKNQNCWKLKKGEWFVFNGVKLRQDDPGNILFGYAGSVMFPVNILRLGAGAYQVYSHKKVIWTYYWTFFDDPRDSSMISYGHDLYMKDTLGPLYYIYKVIKTVKTILFWL